MIEDDACYIEEEVEVFWLLLLQCTSTVESDVKVSSLIQYMHCYSVKESESEVVVVFPCILKWRVKVVTQGAEVILLFVYSMAIYSESESEETIPE